MELLVDALTVGLKRGERQARAQVLPAFRHARTELSQANRTAVEAGGDAAIRTRFKGDVTHEPSGQRCRRGPAPSLRSGSAQGRPPSGLGVKRIELVFRQRPVPP